jgi:DNA polymerase
MEPQAESGMSKRAAYTRLVEARKACDACAQLENPARIENGDLDSEEIGPYSRWLGDLGAALLIVAQDFADVASFRKYGGQPGARVPTNLALVQLLEAAGIGVSTPPDTMAKSGVFLTNAVLCMKSGGMQAGISPACFRQCGERFLNPMIRLVQPRVVVGLGVRAWRSILASFQVPGRVSFRDAVVSRVVHEVAGGIKVAAAYHPSPSVRNTHRPLRAQLEDWRWIGTFAVKEGDGIA